MRTRFVSLLLLLFYPNFFYLQWRYDIRRSLFSVLRGVIDNSKTNS